MGRFYFNNCRGRQHAMLYPEGAFYDLYQSGRQANMATDLKPGDECVVATPMQGGDIEFTWFSFTRERIMEMPDKRGTEIRVQFGRRLRSERLRKIEAVKTRPYSVFFNVNGHFKRLSVIQHG